MGTPSSGTLTNCTFPTLNQNTTGSSASCTGNSATATTATTATNWGSYGAVPTAGAVPGVNGIPRADASGYINFFYINSSTPNGELAWSAVGQILTTNGTDNYYRKASLSGLATNLGVSGTNTGDNSANSLYSGLVSNATHTGDATGSTALTVVKINGTLMSGLATGILKNTTATGVPSIAIAADFPTLNQDTTGYASALKSATTTVSVSAATAPTTGQVLTATDSTHATWQAASASGATLASVSSGTYYPGMSTTSSGVWTAAYVDTTNLYYTRSTSTLNCLAFNATSDARYKDNITSISSALEAVSKMRGVSFNWKENGNKSYGVVAQEIEQILPDIVETNTDLDDRKSVNYNAITGYLIEAIKEQNDKIAKLEALVQTLLTSK